VFLPVAFMGGIIGKFFHEFGITIVVAVLISMFVSFTLDPMLSASGTTRAEPSASRTQAQPEAGRGRDARADRAHPRHRRQRGLQPADLRRHPGQRRRRPGQGGHRLRREGQEDPGVVDVESSVKPGLPAYAVRLKPGAVRELGLTAPQLASSLRAYVNGETATYWTTPDGDQVDVVLRLNEAQRERVEQLRRCRWPLQGRHADHAGQRGRPSSRCSTPRSSGARTCSAARRCLPA
jgi:multidrug efflux pump subunit AcrB